MGVARVDFQGPGTKRLLDVVHHPRRLEADHRAGALRQLLKQRADGGWMLKRGERLMQHRHHAAAGVGHQRLVDGVETEDEDREAGQRWVPQQRLQHVHQRAAAKLAMRQHRVRPPGADGGHQPAGVGYRAKAKVCAAKRLGHLASHLRLGFDCDDVQDLAHHVPPGPLWPLCNARQSNPRAALSPQGKATCGGGALDPGPTLATQQTTGAPSDVAGEDGALRGG